MASVQETPVATRLVLDAITAAELMSPGPVSIRAEATVEEAVAAMTHRGFNAAPVIEESGRAVGVVSRADILIHEREAGPFQGPHAGGDFTRVRDIMTPAVFSVIPQTPADRVVEQMLNLNVHQLFVVDEDGSVIGVISALDVLRRLRGE